MMNNITRQFSWDRGVDFEATRARLETRLARAKNDAEYAYTAVLLTQLANGSRISEAVEAMYKFAETGQREVKVRVRKHKKYAERLIIIPEGIDIKRVAWILDVEQEKLRTRICVYALRKLKVNTHSLRYAFITHLSKKGIAAQIIARVTGHATLDYILHYTQKAAADDVLREVAAKS